MIEDSKGLEIVLAYLNVWDFFGKIGLFDEDHKRSVYVRAKTKSEIAQITYDRLKGLSPLFPELMFEIASQMAIRLRKTSRKVRIARTLIDLCKEPDAITHPDSMLVKITRQELGRIVGCSREMVDRALKDLELDLLISVAWKSIVVFGTR